METYEYRIDEWYNQYRVMVLKQETKGRWWWKETTEKWVEADFWGRPIYYSSRHGLLGRRLEAFASLEKANEAAKKFIRTNNKYRNGVIVHSITA